MYRSILTGGHASNFPIKLEIPPSTNGPPTNVPDVSQFAKVTLELFGVSCSHSNTPFTRGVCNEVYMLSLNLPEGSGPEQKYPRKVIARVACENKAKSDINLDSEVATMVYVERHTSIPVPTVYGYCPTSNNVVGAPFMIISVMSGVMDSASSIWDYYPLEKKLVTIRDYAKIVAELSKHQFDTIGSLYFSGEPTEESYHIGEICWPKQQTEYRRRLPGYNRGPFHTAVEWLDNALKQELEFMDQCPERAETAYGIMYPPGEAFNIAKRILPQVIPTIPQVIDEENDMWAKGPFVIAHMDLMNMCNILFNPDGPNALKITAIIDWEMATTVPLWMLVCPPAWFKGVCGEVRDAEEEQIFRDVYFEELRLHADASVVEMATRVELEWKARFAESVSSTWLCAPLVVESLAKHGILLQQSEVDHV